MHLRPDMEQRHWLEPLLVVSLLLEGTSPGFVRIRQDRDGALRSQAGLQLASTEAGAALVEGTGTRESPSTIAVCMANFTSISWSPILKWCH
jgi:hypothetical protein